MEPSAHTCGLDPGDWLVLPALVSCRSDLTPQAPCSGNYLLERPCVGFVLRSAWHLQQYLVESVKPWGWFIFLILKLKLSPMTWDLRNFLY